MISGCAGPTTEAEGRRNLALIGVPAITEISQIMHVCRAITPAHAVPLIYTVTLQYIEKIRNREEVGV
jgi:hypothetical protein